MPLIRNKQLAELFSALQAARRRRLAGTGTAAAAFLLSLYPQSDGGFNVLL